MSELHDKLFHTARRTNGYDRLTPEELTELEQYCKNYRQYLDDSKTEREAVTTTIRLAEDRGFRPYHRGDALKAGDKIYTTSMNKAILLAVVGEQSLSMGADYWVSHIDSPRLDLKPQPLYEDREFAILKTHYYGGLRKYQWVSIPLELRGVVCRKDGTTVNVALGSDPDDPLLTIPDLLPHLADKQAKEPLWLAIAGEDLNIMVGTRPYDDKDEKERVKLLTLSLLYDKYGITEEDLLSAELSAVPAYDARDYGLDRSMIGAYGQDDRVCAYAGLKALLELDIPQRTAVCILVDKEEIGSMGVTGMRSRFFDTFMEDLCAGQGVDLRTCYENSFCLSADVTAGFDPNYASVYDLHNSAMLNYGINISKYTGSRGKSGSSDAPAEVVAKTRAMLDKGGVIWQMSELGKVDAGGGGTVALYMADRNIPTIDAGTPVLAMHAPLEITAKLDCYMTYRAAKALFNA